MNGKHQIKCHCNYAQVLVIKDANDANLTPALKMNLNNAVHTALLLLPESFTEEEFYLKITGLSYVGDFRMWVGEDKNKVKNIVLGNFEHFRKLYANILNSLQHVHWHREGGKIEVNEILAQVTHI